MDTRFRHALRIKHSVRHLGSSGSAAVISLLLWVYIAAIHVTFSAARTSELKRSFEYWQSLIDQVAAARNAAQWAALRFLSDRSAGILGGDKTFETPPEAVWENRSVEIACTPDSTGVVARVAGPSEPIPPGLFAAIYCEASRILPLNPGVSISPAALEESKILFRVSSQRQFNPVSIVDSRGLVFASDEGTYSIEAVVAADSGNSQLPVFSEDLLVSVAANRACIPRVSLSPKVSLVDSTRTLPVTAVIYGKSGPRQALWPKDSFSVVSGGGWLEPTPWGALYHPGRPGHTVIAVSAQDEEEILTGQLEFDVANPSRAALVQVTVSDRAVGVIRLLEIEGQVRTVAADFYDP